MWIAVEKAMRLPVEFFPGKQFDISVLEFEKGLLQHGFELRRSFCI